MRMIWEEELDEEMGSSGTEGSGETSQKYRRRSLTHRLTQEILTEKTCDKVTFLLSIDK